MNTLPPLNFPDYPFRIAEHTGTLSVWDELRGRWLVLTPEEWVRRHAIRFLVDGLGSDALYVVQEVPVMLHGQPQRADVVAYAPADGGGRTPLLLAECKAPEVRIGSDCLAQAVRYNSVVGARYLFLTNGLKHYFYEMNTAGEYLALDAPPDLKPFY